MSDFATVLDAAQRLEAEDRIRLINALWDTVPENADLPLDPAWGPELQRRAAALDSGEMTTIPWATVRDEALARIGHGTAR
jgi:putative addiction module component (TIGR02574 family)